MLPGSGFVTEFLLSNALANILALLNQIQLFVILRISKNFNRYTRECSKNGNF